MQKPKNKKIILESVQYSIMLKKNYNAILLKNLNIILIQIINTCRERKDKTVICIRHFLI